MAPPTDGPASAGFFTGGGWIHGVAFVLWAGMVYVWLGDGVRVPMGYDGDGFHYLMLFRNLVDGGWALHHPRLGAPFGAFMWDFPNADVGFHVLAWILTCFTSDVGLMFNLFYALGFPAAYASAYWVLRRMGVGVALSAAGAFVFAFLPFHFWRLPHLWLATYFIIPLVVWECVQLWTDASPSLLRWMRARRWSFAVALATGTLGAYFAFFAAMLFAVTGAVAALRARTVRPLAAALLLAGLTSVVVVAQLLPSIAYHSRFGANSAISNRGGAVASQVYGLNLALALTPHETHGIGAGDRLAKAVRETSQVVNENAYAYLGILGIAGTLALLLHSLGGTLPSARPDTISALACVSLASILYATVGGFGYLFALLVTPEIRALNRISVILGFAGIAAFVLVVEALLGRSSRGRPALAAGMCIAMMALALVDQVPGRFAQDRAYHSKRYDADREFVERIETSVPPGTRILILPYVEFPESSYELLRPYVHSRASYWSFGAMRQRSRAQWIQTLSSLPPTELVRLASRSGFGGIYLDGRFFPADGGAAVREAIAAQVGRQWIASAGDGQYFIMLDPSGSVPVDLGVPPTLSAGFYGWEGTATNRWAWSRGEGVMQFLGLETRPRAVDIAFGLQARSPTIVHASWNGGPATSHVVEASRATQVTLRGVVLEPGENALRLRSDLPAQLPGNGDPRPLSFAVHNPGLR